MTAAVLELVRPGPLATIQDLGRVGLGRFGVSPSGVMDRLALRLANRLLGQPDDAAAIELTGPGAELVARAAVTVALAGGDLAAEVDGAPVPLLAPLALAPGARLRFPKRRRGARVVVAVAGGIAARRTLGSAATDLEAGLGERLVAGAQLGARPWTGRLAPLAAAELAAVYESCDPLRFVPTDACPTTLRAAATTFRVSPHSNRTGLRLSPQAPLPAVPPLPRSVPLAPLTIQLPPDGVPILLLADRQSIGGYPILGHLASVDAPRAAQLWPGEAVVLTPVSLAEAQSAAARQRAALARVPAVG